MDGQSETPQRVWSEWRPNVVERKETWLTRRTAHHRAHRSRHRRPLHPTHRRAHLQDRAVLGRVDRGRRVLAVDRAGLAAGSSSAAKRSASSARRRSMRSAIAMYGCCRGLWRSAERSFHAGSRASAHGTSVSFRWPSSSRATSRCWRLRLASNLPRGLARGGRAPEF